MNLQIDRALDNTHSTIITNIFEKKLLFKKKKKKSLSEQRETF